MQQKAPSPRGILNNLQYLFKFIWECDKSIYGIMAFYTLLTAIAPFIGIFAPKFLIDELIKGKRPEMLIGIIVAFFVLSALVSYLTQFCLGKYFPKKYRFAAVMEAKLKEKSMRMDFKNTEDPMAMDKLHFATEAISAWGEGVAEIVNRTFFLLGRLISLVGYLWIITVLNPLLILFLAVNMVVVYFVTEHAKKEQLKVGKTISAKERRGSYIGKVMYDFEYGKDIRIYNLGEYLANKYWFYKKPRVDLYKDYCAKNFLTALVDGLIMILREGLVYAYLIYKFFTEGMSLGDFSMYFSSVVNFTDTMKNSIATLLEIRVQSQYVDAYREYLEQEDEQATPNPKQIPKDHTYEIDFENISFRYPHGQKDIFTNLNLKIKKGQKLAIVGVNGAGKTTLVKLLTRLYEPTGGRILLNGTDIREFGREAYWGIFSVVFQEIKIFALSVAENVALALGGQVDRERVTCCLKEAGIWEKVSTLEKGIDTSLLKTFDENGVVFSGGQSQKIALARALYKDGPVVILDEPTAALDALAEQEIYEKFNSLVKDKTAIYISHRLASTRFCDVIAFFENGQLIEYGTHTELMTKNGRYAEMFRLQAHYYSEEAAQSDQGREGLA